MQFKNPEILWALFFLAIPVIVHLFQLRKFKKVSFTNVKFLKEVVIQTRKSKNLKKWLTLLARLGLFTMIIFAFSQPYFANRNILNTKTERIIYLDNSFSLQANGKKGTLYETAVQDLISTVDEDEIFSVFTNTDTYANTTIKTLKNDLLNFEYSANQLSYKEILLKAKSLFSNDSSSIKNFIVVSDFQSGQDGLSNLKDSIINIKPLVLRSVEAKNINIDSIFIKNSDASGIEINVILKRNSQTEEDEKPVSLFNKDVLIAKAATNFGNQKAAQITFTIPANVAIEGVVSVEDSGLYFDDTFFFSINEKQKVNVLSIGSADSSYLSRIFTQDEFNFTNTALKDLNFSEIEKQNLIILNELETISPAMLNALGSFQKNGGSIIFIPSASLSPEDNNLVLNNFKLPLFIDSFEEAKKITEINFDHPVFKNVFEQRVRNFQYPQSGKGFLCAGTVNKILSYQDNTPFIWNKGSIYVFNASLQADYSNFKTSPLIVPVFYNIAMLSIPLPRLYYNLDTDNTVAITTKLVNDEVLELVKGNERYIPLQQTFSSKVLLNLNRIPKSPGTYKVMYQDANLKNLSFNYQRDESILTYENVSNYFPDITSGGLAQLLGTLKKENSVTNLWKWFVIFATVFLIIEILILKFLK